MEKLEKSPKFWAGPIEVVNADEQHGDREDQDVCRHEDIYGAEDHMLHRASFKMDLADLIRMETLGEFLCQGSE